MKSGCVLVWVLVLCSAPAAFGEDAEPTGEKAVDKSRYNLFNPTPQPLLREMEALYENPYTVDAGHVQVETYPFGYRFHEESFARDTQVTEGWTVAPINLRLGVLNNVDTQLALAPYSMVRIKDHLNLYTGTRSGFGDLVPRVRINLWGNDGGKTAFAVTPFLKVPTSQDGLGNDAYEGGVIFAFAAELPFSWWLVVTPELDALANANSSGYHVEGAGTAYFWHSIVGQLSGYVEFASRASAEPPVSWLGTVDLGLTYMLTRNIQLDVGTRVGITTSADNINPFVGASFRF